MPIGVIAAWSTLTWTTPFAPAPLFCILPSFGLAFVVGDDTFSAARAIVPATAAILYLTLSFPLLLARRTGWLFAAATFVMVATVDAAFFAYAWSYGVRFQGKRYTEWVLLLNIVCAVAIGAALARIRTGRKKRDVVLCQIAIFFWLNWVAFPWLGEML